MIPAEVIAEIRARHELVSFIQSQGIQLRRRGADYVGLCPFHSDSTPSLVVSPRKQYWCCHGACSANGKRVGGDVIEFARRLWGVGFREAVTRLGGDGAARASAVRVASTELRAPALLERVVAYYQKSLVSSQAAREYLVSRGIARGEIIQALQVGYADGTLLERVSERSKMRAALSKLGVITAAGAELFLRCIVLPLRDLAGVIVGMYGRAIDRDQHLYLPGLRRGLVNAQSAATAGELIITESVIDAMSFLEAGIANVVPVYGVNGWTPDHDGLLDKHRVRRVVLALDSDEAGEKASAAIAERLMRCGIDTRTVSLPAKDANELLVREGPDGFARIWRELVSSASPAAVVLPSSLPGAAEQEPITIEGSSTTVTEAAKGKSTEEQTAVPSPSDSASPSSLASSAPSENHASTTPVANPEMAEAAALAAKEESTGGAVPSSVSLPTAAEGAPAKEEAREVAPAAPADNRQPATDNCAIPQLAQEDGAYVLCFEKRRYLVRGLVAIGVERLRVNVRVEQEGRFHVDTFDLYSARARRSFQEAIAERFGLSDATAVVIELDTMIEALERERLELRAHNKSSASEKKAMTPAEREEAMEFLIAPNLVALILDDFRAIGCVGEEMVMLTAYLVAISRLLAQEALAVLFCARSGAGKSTMQKRTVEFVPAEALIERTCVTKQALFYKDENALVHKVLAIDEEGGAAEAAYALRCLQSAGYLAITSTRTDPQTGKQRAEDYRVNGPVAIFLTTAHPEALDYETRNRFMILTIDESKEQTRRILERQRQDDTLDGLEASERKKAILRRHHNAQRLLLPLRVVNNLAPKLLYPSDRLILRREQKKYLLLIKAIALLHQYQRAHNKTSSGETYIEVTVEDVRLATELAQSVLRRNLDELAPPSRSLLIEIRKLVTKKMSERKIPQHHAVVDRKEIQEATGLSVWHLRDYLQQLVEYEYLLPVTGRKGRRYLYELLWDGTEEDLQFPPSVLNK
ncbi:MAG: DNA primase [Pseudomonadota bacterium]